ncbi:unnamed protein product [Rotaria socialis]
MKNIQQEMILIFLKFVKEFQKNDLRDSSINRFRIFDEISEIITLKINEDCDSSEYPDGLIWDETTESIYTIKKNDPQSLI